MKVKYREWQFGFGIAQRVWCLSPYCGVKISGSKFSFGGATYRVGNKSLVIPRLENRFEIGYAFGVSVVGFRRLAVTVEGRFHDENALYINTQYRF